MTGNLHDRIAVVTGGARGIGAATARVLERAGARVRVFDVHDSGHYAVDVTSEPAVRAGLARVADE